MGLVHFPTTLAPVNGSVNVTTQCGDNTHIIRSSLNVSSTSNGSWSGTTPQCQSVNVILDIVDTLLMEDRFVKVGNLPIIVIEFT